MPNIDIFDLRRRVDGYAEALDAVGSLIGILQSQIAELEEDANNLREILAIECESEKEGEIPA